MWFTISMSPFNDTYGQHKTFVNEQNHLCIHSSPEVDINFYCRESLDPTEPWKLAKEDTDNDDNRVFIGMLSAELVNALV